MILTDRQPHRVEVTVLGEFELADFKQFETLFDEVLAGDAPVDLYFDLRGMAGFTVDVAWEEVVFSRQHGKDFRRIAVIAEHRWEAWAVWLTKLSAQAELRVFADEEGARSWLAGAL
ncbi:STAS/SEC14 domain-containing protein [Rhodocyclus tenuis]|uniref:STAS/SEC14 domain-containing protein n=1 Tax=Rhodocyclus tenuis TaxID=1066 RepID=UPI00190818C1|nr:STAS/SEC14 domain-containing protein [Rhodocyclus tenuis]MBK1680049.1 STAS/SEC14 domain-containing protein [Rhodocyclus tenuis]